MATVYSSHGTVEIDDGGAVVAVDLDTSADGWTFPLPVRFDVAEYLQHYGGNVPGGFDILDIGYWDASGRYIEPETDFRAMVASGGGALMMSQAAGQILTNG
jgi:hypothetical protein